MRRDAGIKLTWTSYYQSFQNEFNFEPVLRTVQYKIAELAGNKRNRKCTECGKTGSHATSCSKYKEPTPPHLTQLEAKLLDTASRAHGIVKAVKQGGNLDEAIAEFESNAPTPEKLVEYAERPVKPSLGDVAAQPNKQSSNLRVADKPLNAEEAKLIKPAPQFPVIRQGNENKLFTFLSEGRVDRKSMLDSVFGGIDEGSFLKHLRKFSQRICDKFHDGVYEVSVYSKKDRVVIDQAAYDKLVAEVAVLPKAAKVKTVKPVVAETPTPSVEPDAEVVSTTKVGDKSEPTPHGFYYEFVKDEKPYAVRDMNNPHVGIMCKFKSKTEADKYINDREREAAATKVPVDAAAVPEVGASHQITVGLRLIAEAPKPPEKNIEPVLESGKTYLVRCGSQNELQVMIYDGRDGDQYAFIPSGKLTGHAVLEKNAPKVWELDEKGETRPVKIPSKLVLIRKLTQ